MVVTLKRRLSLARMPCSFMSFCPRSLPTAIPLASSDFQMRGQPCASRLWVWTAKMCTSSASSLRWQRWPALGSAGTAHEVFVVSGRAQPQHPALYRDRPHPPVAFSKGVFRVDPLGKYAVAFAKMSRFIFTRANSALSRLISISSKLTGLLSAPLGLPARCALTQLKSA